MAVPFGKYLLESKLAEGGMAEIFLARQPGFEGFERQVVVKRLLPELSTEHDFVRMFLNEARLAARLNHPHIVQIYELGQEEGAYFLAMEYIRGEDLRSLAQQADAMGMRPSPGLVCRIICEVLSGLHYAHTRTGPDGKPLGLVHRDISPQNILVTYDGTVKIIDFGIAKATQRQSSDQTQAGLLKGKYAYMSPEQTRGGQIDARSDIFSAGILLWELLTWKRLFKRSTDLATLVAISDEPAPPPSHVNPDLPPELDPIVLGALAVHPDDRYPSAQAFQTALEEFIAAHGLTADTRALRQYMHELFRDKLAQEASTPRPALSQPRRPGSPLTMPLQTLDGTRRRQTPPGQAVAVQGPQPVLDTPRPEPMGLSPPRLLPSAETPVNTRTPALPEGGPHRELHGPPEVPRPPVETQEVETQGVETQQEPPARRPVVLAAATGLVLGLVVVLVLQSLFGFP